MTNGEIGGTLGPLRTRLALLLGALGTLAVWTASAAARPDTVSACPSPGVRGVIAGLHLCLTSGQPCRLKYESVYVRLGFVCSPQLRLRRRAPSQLDRSIYLSLAEDRTLSAPTVLLSTVLELAKPDAVLVESDGTFAPASTGAAASIYVQVDGARVGNLSTIDWRGSVDAVRHSFNAIGAAHLNAGRHLVEVVGEPIAGSFTVGTSSNLSVLVHPAATVSTAQLQAPAGPFDYPTLGKVGPDLPHAPLLRLTRDLHGPSIALGSATGRPSGHDGDGMLGIYADGRHPGPASSLWTVNDLCTCAEVEAPMFTHALLRGGGAASTVSLDATEFPWSIPPPAREDPVKYRVEPSATLLLLGGPSLVGSASSRLPFFPDSRDTVSDGWCIGSSSAWPGCPHTGTDVLLAEATVIVPAGHPGVLMVLAKTRVQGDASDPGGAARLWITVDGAQRGSIGVQELAAPFSISQRTISASYLATGAEHLRPGRHQVQVHGSADGAFIHLVYLRDLPLLWFD